MDPLSLFMKLIEVGGLAFALASLALVALLRGDVVVRKSYQEMLTEKDNQIKREQDRNAELWEIVLPSISVGRGALDKLESERRPSRK